MSAPVENLVARLKASRCGKGWIARCPAHEDHKPSLSINEGRDGRALVNCGAGCKTSDVLAEMGMTFRDLFPANSQQPSCNDAIRSASKPRSTPTAATPFDWPACLAAFTDDHIERLAKWRGYSVEFCSWLKENQLIGLYNGCIAFPIRDQSGSVVAVHYKPISDRFKWLRYPKGFNTRPIVIGELRSGEPIYVFESQWDAFAFMDVSGERNGIVITLGAANAAVAAALIPTGSTIYLWTQNDAAGDKWQADFVAHSKNEIKRVSVPSCYKDLNEWTKRSATSDDLFVAMNKVQAVQDTTLAKSPDKLFREIRAHIARYVVFNRPEHEVVVVLWVMHTWVVDLFDFTPYLYLHSPVMRCGKTQVHRVVEPLVKNPLRTCNISESALFREIADSRPTLLWDEIDSIFGNRKASEANEDKRALLNAGYERGIMAIRMERSGSGFKKITYDPFCPKILAGIGHLPETIVDRSIPILIHRKLRTQSCEKYRRRDRDLAKPIYDSLKTWSANPELLKTLRASRPQMPDYLSDRQEDIWEPLLAIADSIGSDVPRLASEAARALCDNNQDEGSGSHTTYLAAIRKAVGEQSRITSADLIDRLWKAEVLPSRLMEEEEPNRKKIGHWLSKLIKSYGGKPARQLDFDGQNARGYEAAELKETFDRYCPE
jgi:hypothetical protein